MVVIGASDPVIEDLLAKDTVPLWKKRNLILLYLLLFPACLGIEITSGFDSSLMNGIQSLKYWQIAFNYPTGPILGLLTASYNLGSCSALPFISLISDHFGRRGSIAFGSAVMIVGSLLQCFAVNITMWVFARIFLGHGVVFAIVGGGALLSELAHPKERAILMTFYGGMYSLGSLIAAGIVLNTLQIQSDWSWRLPSILQAAPSVLQLALIYLVPESPRWLVSRGRGEEALKSLIKYHAEGDEMAELPRLEYSQIQKALELEDSSRVRGWGELFQTSGMRRRSFVSAFMAIFSQWSGNLLLNLYLVKILAGIGFTDSITQNRITVGFQAWNTISFMTFALTIPRLPRRKVFLCGTCLILGTYVWWIIGQAQYTTTGSKAAGYATLVSLFLFNCAYIMTWNTMMQTYLVELFPYYARTKGLSWYQLWQKGSGFFSTFVNPIGLDAISWKFLFVYLCVIVFELFFVWFFFPETSNRSLEELAFLFESQNEKNKITESQDLVVELGSEDSITELSANVDAEKKGAPN